MSRKPTVCDFRVMKENGRKIVMITAYDAIFSRIAASAVSG